MAPSPTPFPEATLGSTPIRNLGLKIAGTRLEPIVQELEAELRRAGVRRLRPHFYLSTEWGVPFGTVSIAIPFYLARPDLTALQAERVGLVEGLNRGDILRYLRHEMGHVVNYAYRLYEQAEWVKLFGAITQPYEEDYRPRPFSRRFVAHLPGWYAQKHPDEDWAETFAVWMTPGRDWRAEYAHAPEARAKLEYCARTLADVGDREPAVTATELDEDVGDLPYSLDQFYGSHADPGAAMAGFDGALRAICEDLAGPEDAATAAAERPFAELIRRLERELMANVYRWTGHFPERTRVLLRYLEERARQLGLHYHPDREEMAGLALTTFVTALAMNHVHRGAYFPAPES
jgi:hypothetical protein